jgi:hypothetical protein
MVMDVKKSRSQEVSQLQDALPGIVPPEQLRLSSEKSSGIQTYLYDSVYVSRASLLDYRSSLRLMLLPSRGRRNDFPGFGYSVSDLSTQI